MELAVQHNNLGGQSIYYPELSSVYLHLGNFTQSQVYASQTFEISKGIGRIYGELSANRRIGMAALMKGELQKAISYFQKAAEQAIESSVHYTVTNSKCFHALCYLILNKVQDAIVLAREASEYAQLNKASIRDFATNELLLNAIALVRVEDFVKAKTIFREQFDRFETSHENSRWAYKYYRALALAGLAMLEEDQTKVDFSLNAYESYSVVFSF